MSASAGIQARIIDRTSGHAAPQTWYQDLNYANYDRENICANSQSYLGTRAIFLNRMESTDDKVQNRAARRVALTNESKQEA